MKPRVGWIGTGVMGEKMCGHLLAAGYGVSVHNRTEEKLRTLLEAGASRADSPRDVAWCSDIVFTMVGYPRDVRDVVLGPDGVLAGCRPGMTIVDMTTSEPALAVEIHERAAEKQVQSLDAPVSGGDVGARNASLSIMVGGSPEAFQRVLPLFEKMGKTIVPIGGPGAGQHAKLTNQIMIACNMISLCEGLLYAYKAGLDGETLLKAVSGGGAASRSIDLYGPRLLARDFEPGFYVEHFLKDMGLALAEAERMNLALPGLALAKQLYESVRALGMGRKGTQALLVALENLSGVKR